jgi:hypothetical protein
LHNAFHISAEILPSEVGATANKILQYFHLYTLRVEVLKELRDFANIECKQILGSVKPSCIAMHSSPK